MVNHPILSFFPAVWRTFASMGARHRARPFGHNAPDSIVTSFLPGIKVGFALDKMTTGTVLFVMELLTWVKTNVNIALIKAKKWCAALRKAPVRIRTYSER
ncbi:MAG: hypothetical protein IKD53_02750, partial [Clostridia bacterium]|nr:hypothetical protein [Clostridia bacterium]